VTRSPRDLSTDLERALDATGGLACLACRPQLLEAARALFTRTSKPTRDDIRALIVDSSCLCTTYKPVLEAMLLAARWREDGE